MRWRGYDAGVTDTPRTPDPDRAPDAPGERRLARPPSDRYATTPAAPPHPGPADAADGASPARGIAFAVVVAILGGAVIVLLGGALAVSAGLLVVAVTLGYAVALAVATGARDTLAPPARPWIAVVLAGLGVVLGQVGLWLFARSEGGVLAPLDYLGQTFGALVPLELVLGAVTAWWRAR